MPVSIPEAAQRLNVSVDSIRRRVRSGALPASRDERGQWWLELGEDPAPVQHHGSSGAMALGTATPLRRSDQESLIVALEDQIDDLRARLDRSEEERRQQAEQFRGERERLLGMIERLSVGKGE